MDTLLLCLHASHMHHPSHDAHVARPTPQGLHIHVHESDSGGR